MIQYLNFKWAIRSMLLAGIILAAFCPNCVWATIDDGLAVNYGQINTTVTLSDPSTEYLDVGPFSPFLPVTGYVVLLGPVAGGDEGPGVVSDYLVSFTGSSLQLYSDEYANWPPDLSGLTQLGSINETGGWQPVGNYFGINPDQIQVLSDVPEPTTIALLAFGGLALLRRNRK